MGAARMTLRQWVAWKLVSLAARIYDSESYTRLTVYTPAGERVVEWMVVDDAYGGGMFSQDTHGCPEGYRVEWEDATDEWRAEYQL